MNSKNSIIWVLLVIIGILVGVYIIHNNNRNEDWTLFVYDNQKNVEDIYYFYGSLSDCWDGAVTATQRGQKYFECGRNCGDFSRTTVQCDFICPQGKLFECEESL
jgi:hypothetical protein